MTTRDDALTTITALMREHHLTPKDVTQALKAASSETRGSLWTKIFAYLGGIFILSGIAAFMAMFWDAMPFALQVAVTLGTGLLCYLLALTAAFQRRYEKTITPLLLLAAALEPGGLFVILDHFSTGQDWRLGALFVSGVMVTQMGFTFLALPRTTPLFMALLFGSWAVATLLDYTGMDDALSGLILGAALTAAAWRCAHSRHHAIAPFWFLTGGIAVLAATFDLVEGSPAELLFLIVNVGLIYLSTLAPSRTLLGVSSLGLLWYIGYFTAEHFVDSIGWPITLIIMGIIFFAVSGMVLRLGRRIAQEQRS